MAETTSSVTTVNGPVSVDDLGVTLTHEHVLVDATRFFTPDPDPVIAAELDQGVTPSNLGHLRRSLVNCLDDLVLDDDDLAVAELGRYRARGGRTVWDVTSHGLRQKDHALRVRRIASESGLNIVMGTGAYTELHHPEWVEIATDDAIAERFIEDLTEGVDGTGIRCGVIGEVGIGTPMTDAEERVLRASARAHLETGAPIVVHQTEDGGETRHRVIDVLESMGVALDKVIMGHIGHIKDFDVLAGVLDRGTYVALDTIGFSGSWGERELPHDMDCVRLIKAIADAGYADRLVLSHDVGHKRLLREYGGTGYDHICVDIPPLLDLIDVERRLLDKLLVDNPRAFLS